MRKLIHKLTSFLMTAFVSLFVLGGCARIVGSARVSQVNNRALSGVVQLARVGNSQIQVFALLENGQKGDLLAETTTNQQGEYSLSLGNYSGPVIIESEGGTYTDEATGLSKTASSMSAIADATQASNAPLTPLSSLVRERTLELFKNGVGLATAEETASAEIAKVFGLEVEDLRVLPADPSASDSLSLRETRAALAIASFSYLMKKVNEASSSEVSVETAMAVLAADIKSDGKLDGRNNGNLLDSAGDLPFRLAVHWANYLEEGRLAFLQDADYSHLLFKNSITLAEVSRTNIDLGTENLNGMVEGIFYLNGVNTGLSNGNGVFLGKYYLSGQETQLSLAGTGTHASKFYEGGELANAFTNGECYVNGVGTLVNGCGPCLANNKYYLSGQETQLSLAGTGTHASKFYEGGELANAFTNGECYVNGVGTLVNGSGPCLANNKYYLSGQETQLSLAGTGTHASKFYVEGGLANGLQNGKYYLSGVLANGFYSNVCYNNGNGTTDLDQNGTGLCSGDAKFYYEFALANGLMSNGKRYSNGDPFQGYDENNKFYKNGVILNGVSGHQCFVEGEANFDLDMLGTGYCSGDMRFYFHSQLANGVHSFMWQGSQCYKDGISNLDLNSGEGLCSGDNRYYKWWSPASGVYGSVCYLNGDATNDLDNFGTGYCNANGKFYVNGAAFSGVYNNTCYFNGDSQMNFMGGTGYCEVGGINKYFINGSPANEFMNNECYVDGVALFNGTGFCPADNKYYSNGALANEFVNGECYVNGVALPNGTGLCTYDNKHYFNGALYTGWGITGQIGESNRYYSEGVLANGRFDGGTCFVNGESQTESSIDWYVFGDYGSTPIKDSNLANKENYWIMNQTIYAKCLPDTSFGVYIHAPAKSGELTANRVVVTGSLSDTAIINTTGFNASVTFSAWTNGTLGANSFGGVMSGGTINSASVTFGGGGTQDNSIMEGGTINADTVSFNLQTIYVGGTINAQTINWNGFTGIYYSNPEKPYYGKMFSGGRLANETIQGVTYVDGIVVTATACSGDCYADAQSLEIGTERQGPEGTTMALEYANGSSGFKVWKEKNGSRVLNATGLIENGWQKVLTRAGTAFDGDLINSSVISQIEGRVCPTHVFLSHSDMTATGRCLYYDSGNAAQRLDKNHPDLEGPSGAIEAEDWLRNWNQANTGRGTSSSYYEGNIKTCADKGMRLPVVYETSVTSNPGGESNQPTGDLVENGGSLSSHPSFAGANGVPDTSSLTFTASAEKDDPGTYFRWLGTSNNLYPYWWGNSLSVRCILPSH